MGISRYPSCVYMPQVEKPYPTILQFLTRRFPRLGQPLWTQRISAGKVLDSAGVSITFDTPYLPQQKLYYFREVTQEPLIPLSEKILFHNAEILVACKPPFMPVTPSGPYVNECLLNRLRATTGNPDLAPLHRIDRETSGLVLFSTNKNTRGRYGELFLSGLIEKTYEALAEVKQCPEAREWTVENRLVRAQTWFRTQLEAGPINARSKIKLLSVDKGCGHFMLFPLTGKKHQLRVHMSSLGFRIINDRYYPELLPKQADDQNKPLQLVARRVKFNDPICGTERIFESTRELLFQRPCA